MRLDINNFLIVFAFCLTVLFLAGCVEPADYIHKREVFELPKEEAGDKDLESAEPYQEEWIGSFLEEADFSKECPACQRRYRDYQDRCPYDGVRLIER